jgi:hypothetical protein
MPNAPQEEDQANNQRVRSLILFTLLYCSMGIGLKHSVCMLSSMSLRRHTHKHTHRASQGGAFQAKYRTP